MGAARQAVGALGNGTEDAETDGADEARVDDAAVAEAGGAEVDGVVGRWHESGAGAGVGDGEAKGQVGEQTQRGGRLEEGAVCDVRGLLEEGRGGGGLVGVVWVGRLGGCRLFCRSRREGEDVDGDGGVGCCEDGVHGGYVL